MFFVLTVVSGTIAFLLLAPTGTSTSLPSKSFSIPCCTDPATANNGFNYNFGRWNVVVWPYLNQFIASGTSPWILLDKKYNNEYGSAMWLDRVQLEVRSELAGNDANVWKGYARFIAGFNDWRGYAVGGVTGGTQLIATSDGG